MVQRNARRFRRVFLELIPDILVRFVATLVRLGFLPFLAGIWLLQQGLENAQIIPFSLGLSLLCSWRRSSGESDTGKPGSAARYHFCIVSVPTPGVKFFQDSLLPWWDWR